MADWRNRLEQIINKFKFQLNAKGVDNLVQLKDVFLVSALAPSLIKILTFQLTCFRVSMPTKTAF